MYYRVAIRLDGSPHWYWESRIIATLDALLRVLRLYRTMPGEHVNVFRSTSVAGLDLMLAHANEGLTCDTLTVDQVLDGEWSMNQCEMKPLEAELRTHESGDTGEAPSGEPALQGKSIHTTFVERVDSLDMRRLALELGTPDDHDAPYQFTFPTTLSQTLVWVKLLTRVNLGELQP
jgi:hypothetical protein